LLYIPHKSSTNIRHIQVLDAWVWQMQVKDWEQGTIHLVTHARSKRKGVDLWAYIQDVRWTCPPPQSF